MTDISVLLASRGRYAALADAIDSIRDNATDADSIEVIVAMDPDDLAMHYVKQSRYGNGDAASLWVTPERYGYVRLNEYLNGLIKMAKGTWVVWFNDDMEMLTKGWDKVVTANRPAVVWPHANHANHTNIVPIWPREWSVATGHGSPSSHCDTYWHYVADVIGRHDKVPIEIRHNRADITGANNDLTYAEGRKLIGSEGMVPGFNAAELYQHVATDAAIIKGLLG